MLREGKLIIFLTGVSGAEHVPELGRSSPAHKVQYQGNGRQHEQKVNQPAGDVKNSHSQQPSEQ